MSKKINININKDDSLLNDYLFCLSEFGKIPNKISIFNVYKIKEFIDFIEKISISKTISKEIIPTGVEYIINEKHFIKINDNIYISFMEYDKMSDLGIITDVIIYYLPQSEDIVNKLISDINLLIVDYQDMDIEQRFNMLSITPDGLQLDPIDTLQADYENIELYYNDNVIKKSKKLIKSIKKENKGLSIIYGERGVGKTVLLNHIVSNIDKMCIFIPSNMIDVMVNSSDFRSLIKRYRNSIIVIDDCEIFFSHAYTKSNILTNNLLQMIDGLSSDMDNLHIIALLNIENVSEIDPILLECNNMIDIIEVDRLKDNKVKEICKYLNQKNKFKNPKIVDIIRNKRTDGTLIEMGF